MRYYSEVYRELRPPAVVTYFKFGRIISIRNRLLTIVRGKSMYQILSLYLVTLDMRGHDECLI